MAGSNNTLERTTLTIPTVPASYDFNGTATGYVLGGGIEYKFSPSWSLKAEYQYLNFGKNDATTSAAAANPAFSGNGIRRWL